jgi:hypothetical protein
MGFGKTVWYVRRHEHQDLALPPSVILTPKEEKRIKHYYLGTDYVSFIYTTLRGYVRTPDERNLFANLAALTSFFDDLADAYRQKDETGISWYNNPEKYGQVADERGLSLHLLNNIYKKLPLQHFESFKNMMHEIFNVETEGRQHLKKELAMAHMEKISADKGGYAALLFRRLLYHDMDAAEYAAVYQLGYLIQICDDILDLWFDCQEDVATIPRFLMEQGRLDELHFFFDMQVDKTYNLFKKMPYKKSRIETAYMMIHYLVSITRLSLKRYGQLEQKYGFIPFDNRKEMVLDMAKWRNRAGVIAELFKRY